MSPYRTNALASSRPRRSWIAAIVIGIAIVTVSILCASRFFPADPSEVCTKYRALVLDAIGREGHSDRMAAFLARAEPGRCEGELAFTRALHHGPRARLVQANMGRCILRASQLETAQACVHRAANEPLSDALLHSW